MRKYYTILALLIIVHNVISIPCAASGKKSTIEGLEPPVTTLILIRHAEKSNAGDDPALSEKGEKRAQDLDRMLSHADLTAIYSTDYIRTRETVAPAAATHDLEIHTYEAHDFDALFDRIKKENKGGTVLIAGHSNTIPAMLNYLTGTENYESLPSHSYDNLYLVTLTRKRARVIALKYGSASLNR